MQDATLLKIAITTSLLGIVVLFFLSKTMTVMPSTMDEANQGREGTYLALQGTVDRILVRQNATFVVINASCTMTGVVFGQQNISLPAGTQVVLRGKLQTYKGEKEIIIDEIIRS